MGLREVVDHERFAEMREQKGDVLAHLRLTIGGEVREAMVLVGAPQSPEGEGPRVASPAQIGQAFGECARLLNGKDAIPVA